MVSKISLATVDNIKSLIKFYGSQKKLAAAVGVNQSQISRYLKGTRVPRKAIVESIKKTYNIKKVTIKKAKGFIKKPYHKRLPTTGIGKHNDGRKFVRFDFPLWRKDISDPTILPELFKKFRFLYNSVKDEVPQIKAQRLGIAISTESRTTNSKDYFSTKAKRKYSRKKEELDFITTIIYARNKASADLMFDDLLEKIKKYLMGTLESATLHEDEETREAKTFFVFFEGETTKF